MSTNSNAPMMPSASKHGFFLGLALILMQTIFYLADIQVNSGIGYLSYLVLIGGLFLAIKAYRDQHNNGYLKYGRAVGYGVLVSLFSGIIASVFVFILYGIIDPGLIDKLLLESENAMMDQGLDGEQLEMAMEMNKKFMTPTMMSIFGVIGQVFMGLVFSLVLAVFLKKEDANTFENDTL
ncbi:MAG: DUF4199 domain-containing protein [Bacteroidetes bacterium]|nr:DUF4199 domain-containing protein [Bacteroidota bacterium]